MKPAVILITAALALTACAPNEITPPPPRAGEPAQQSKAPDPKSDPSDICNAKNFQYLVGRPKTEIPVPVNPRNRRVTCTACPVTMDFNPERLNIFFDQATGIVKEVKCG